MDNPKVYSYLRFSDPKQAAGSSADRQTAYAQRWAADRGMVLDEALSLRDEGLSAYHQRHITQGALGAFLRAVDAKLIAPGSVLVVEGLDRLSRAEPVLAQAQLAQIINAGITVVTASDGREYNRASLKAQPMDLVYSLLVMIRAHEESDTKSKRVRAAIRRQCVAWQAGTFRGVIRNGKDPKWVRWTGTGFELVPDRAAAMRAAIALFLAGNGGYRVMRALREQGYTADQVPTTSGTLYKALKRPDLIGTKTLAIGITYNTLRTYFERARRDIGMPGLWFHDLRHTAASWWIASGASLAARIRGFQFRDIRPKAASEMELEHARKLLGHTNQQITATVYRRVGETVKPTK